MVNPLEFNTKNEFMRDKQSKKKRVKSKRNSYFFKPYINYKNSIYKSSFIKFRSIPQFCDNT